MAYRGIWYMLSCDTNLSVEKNSLNIATSSLNNAAQTVRNCIRSSTDDFLRDFIPGFEKGSLQVINGLFLALWSGAVCLLQRSRLTFPPHGVWWRHLEALWTRPCLFFAPWYVCWHFVKDFLGKRKRFSCSPTSINYCILDTENSAGEFMANPVESCSS